MEPPHGIKLHMCYCIVLTCFQCPEPHRSAWVPIPKAVPGMDFTAVLSILLQSRGEGEGGHIEWDHSHNVRNAEGALLCHHAKRRH